MISPGRAIGRITDQYVRKTPAPSMRAASSIVVGMPHEELPHEEDAGGVDDDRQDHPRVAC